LSENTKLRLDLGASEHQSDRQSGSPDEIAQIDEAESQMRKALGLLGDAPRHRAEPDRSDPQNRSSGSTGAFSGGLHRRRFVQDGDVPVTVLRRDIAHDPAAHRAAPASAAPTSNRLQRAEAALAAETAMREKSERALSDSQNAVRDLQTKIGHAELARNEALDALRRERDAAAQVRAAFDALKAELESARDELEHAQKLSEERERALDEERRLRKAAEKAQKIADAAREEAERLVRALSEVEVTAAPAKAVKPARNTGKATGDLFAAETPKRGAAEPEPVKWWLNSGPAGKRK
jgi:hypothetical protein